MIYTRGSINSTGTLQERLKVNGRLRVITRVDLNCRAATQDAHMFYYTFDQSNIADERMS